MEKIINYYKGISKGISRSSSNSISTIKEKAPLVFPFMYHPHPSEKSGNNYGNTKDYLYIPDIFSIKNYWYPETISLILALITISTILIILLAEIFSTNILVIVTAFIAVLYLILLLFKLLAVYKGFSYDFVDFSKEEIDSLSDKELPVYTVFVPLLNEANVIDQIIESMTSLNYPKNKIDMIVTLEGYDKDTIEAIKKAKPPKHFRTSIIPYVTPQTKPKTLNIAFREAKGEFAVIYDAEIMPDADQMKKAYLAFKKHPEIACFQTRLEHYNTDKNILTKLFNMEFSFYYDYFLPGLQKLGFPLPLSGHSTHFRMEALYKIGGWDSYNVAEDCDLGIRLYRYGYKTGMINSVSREEAASDVWTWIKQRTRWMKGFIQTSIVHLRHPIRFKNDVGGWKNFGAFLVTVPGTVLVNFVNLVSWFILFYWILTESKFIQGLYPQIILYISVTTFAVGIFTFTYLNLLGSYKREKFDLVKYGLLTPIYWMLLAFATTRAVYQTFTNPFKWEKTMHAEAVKR